MHDQDENVITFGHDECPPLDMLAALFEARGWSYEIDSEENLSAVFKGSWTSYRIRAVYREIDNTLQILILPDVVVPLEKCDAVYKALALINEQLWLGHFDIWSASKVLLFRHGTILPPNGMLSIDHAQNMVDLAIDECERFYPVFQFIIWGDKTAEDALDAALIDTMGEA